MSLRLIDSALYRLIADTPENLIPRPPPAETNISSCLDFCEENTAWRWFIASTLSRLTPDIPNRSSRLDGSENKMWWEWFIDLALSRVTPYIPNSFSPLDGRKGKTLWKRFIDSALSRVAPPDNLNSSSCLDGRKGKESWKRFIDSALYGMTPITPENQIPKPLPAEINSCSCLVDGCEVIPSWTRFIESALARSRKQHLELFPSENNDSSCQGGSVKIHTDFLETKEKSQRKRKNDMEQGTNKRFKSTESQRNSGKKDLRDIGKKNSKEKSVHVKTNHAVKKETLLSIEEQNEFMKENFLKYGIKQKEIKKYCQSVKISVEKFISNLNSRLTEIKSSKISHKFVKIFYAKHKSLEPSEKIKSLQTRIEEYAQIYTECKSNDKVLRVKIEFCEEATNKAKEGKKAKEKSIERMEFSAEATNKVKEERIERIELPEEAANNAKEESIEMIEYFEKATNKAKQESIEIIDLRCEESDEKRQIDEVNKIEGSRKRKQKCISEHLKIKFRHSKKKSKKSVRIKKLKIKEHKSAAVEKVPKNNKDKNTLKVTGFVNEEKNVSYEIDNNEGIYIQDSYKKKMKLRDSSKKSSKCSRSMNNDQVIDGQGISTSNDSQDNDEFVLDELLSDKLQQSCEETFPSVCDGYKQGDNQNIEIKGMQKAAETNDTNMDLDVPPVSLFLNAAEHHLDPSNELDEENSAPFMKIY